MGCGVRGGAGVGWAGPRLGLELVGVVAEAQEVALVDVERRDLLEDVVERLRRAAHRARARMREASRRWRRGGGRRGGEGARRPGWRRRRFGWRRWR